MSLWHYVSRTWARKAWQAWIAWAVRSRLEPVKKVARMIRKHLDGIINAIVLGVTNAPADPGATSRASIPHPARRKRRNRGSCGEGPGKGSTLDSSSHRLGLDPAA